MGDWVISVGLNIALGPKAQTPAEFVAAPAFVAPVYVAPAPARVAITPPPPPVAMPVAPAPYVAPVRAIKQGRF